MPSALPDGDPAPASGRLPTSALNGIDAAPFGIYVHVPFCRVRCGYCDFNTYALPELGASAGSEIGGYADLVLRELDLAVDVLGAGDVRGVGGVAPVPPAVQTVFVGGGTPTVLPAADLARVVHGIWDRWGLAPDAEVTTEANPDTVTPDGMAELAAAGYTRVSLGMQSAVPHVLATLDRTHEPAAVARAVEAVRSAGMAVSLDLIYGTPGETLEDWRRSLDAALDLEPDHVSAYALVVEEGTRLAGQVRRGEVAMPDDDDEAAKYEVADSILRAAGFGWYEVSNWSTSEATRCRHNIGYWAGGNWWGAGPGAHSHIGGVRWWNVKHPRAYAARLGSIGEPIGSPAAAREELTARQRADERVLLGVRLADGLPITEVPDAASSAVAGLIAEGLIDGPAAVAERRIRLTLRGRLLADTVVRRLVD
jgi:oxygen-independent coproporphyrinogen-3 oxidase